MRIFLLVAIVSLYINTANRIDTFIEKYVSQYESDARLRYNETCVYVPRVMNLMINKYQNKSAHDRRRDFFNLLSMKHMMLTYPDAFDIRDKHVLSNPYGDMDYWDKCKRPVIPVIIPDKLIHEERKKEALVLIDFIVDRKPDHIFTIADIDGIQSEIFWVIVNNQLFTLLYYRDSGTIEEYDAASFVESIAPDYVFDSSLRLEMLLQEDGTLPAQ